MPSIPRLTPIASALATALALAAPIAFATQTVTTCADSGVGSLRAAIANAAITGDTVTFNTAAMACSTITLATGAFVISATDLTIAGPGAGALTIDAHLKSRVFDHIGSGTLNVNDLTLTNGSIRSSNSPYGGCIYSKGTVSLMSSTLSTCRAFTDGSLDPSVPVNAFGGGIFAGVDLRLQSSTITNSIAVPTFTSGRFGAGYGGGAYARGNLVVQSSTVTSNSADFGGGFSSANATIVGTTLSGNSAGTGGGLLISNRGSPGVNAHVSNSTISGNSAYLCAGIEQDSGTLTLSNSTIAFNTAQQGSASGHSYASGLCAAGLLNIQSSIVAKNEIVVGTVHTPSDFSAQAGTSIAGANNLIMVTLAGTTPPAGTLTADPMLTALANNGGSTMTHSLGVGSPAIGTGNNALRLASDQRGPGFARMTKEKTDIGAFQTGDGIFASGFE